jgi:O-antigen ligase
MVRDFKLIRFISLTLSIILIFLITIYDDTAKKRMWDSTINQIGINSKKINLFSIVHESHYLSAYKMFLDKKFLGIGVRNFRNFCSQPEYFGAHERSCSTHPHNTYIQILAETGLIGFAFIILILFYFIFKCVLHFKGAIFQKKYYFNDFEICLLAAILITIWPFVPSGNFFNNWISIIYYFPVGFLLWSLKKSDQKRKNLSLTIKQK